MFDVITERRRPEQELRVAIAQLNQAQEIANMGSFVYDIATNHVSSSPQLEKILGLGVDHEETPTAWNELLHAEDRSAVEAAWTDCVQNGVPFDMEYRIIRRSDGQTRWLRGIGKAEADPTGKVVRVTAVNIDRTEQRKVDLALSESEERYRRLFEVESDAIVLVDRDTKAIVDANPSALKSYGYNRQEFLQLKISDVSAEPEKSSQAVNAGLTFVALRWHRKKDGSVFPVEISGDYFEVHGQKLQVAAIRDITERIRAEAAVREGEANLRAILEASPVAMAVNDEHDNMTFLNPKFIETFGYALVDIPTVAAWWPRAFPDPAYRRQVAHEWQAAIEKAHREGTALDSEDHRVTCKDGTVRDIRFSLAPMGTSQVVILHDITERKQAQEKLQESESRLKRAHQIARLGNWEWDLITNQLYWADENYRIHGIDPQEVAPSYEAFLQVIDPAERDFVNKAVADALAGKSPYEIDYTAIRADNGKKCTIHAHGEVIKDGAGKAVKMVGTVQDITERKQTEIKLRETNDYLENLINHANAPIVVWDPQFRITRFNHAFESLTGRSEAEVRGQSLELLFPPALVESSIALILGTLSGERWEVVEIKIQHRDGSERTVLWNSATLFATDGQTPLATIAQGQDITERKRMEEVLRESEARLRAITDSAQDAILMMNPEGCISYWNPAAERIFGYTSAEAIGQNLHSLLAPPRYHEAQQAALPQFWQNGQGPAVGKTTDMEGRRKDGQEVSVQLSLSAIQIEGRWHAVGILRDITERKRAEAAKEEMEAQNRQLQKAESLGRMAGAIAHSFNNQLAAVIMNLELLQQELPPNAGSGLDLSRALQSARAAASISTQMLVYLGQSHVQREALDLSEACRQSLPLLEAAIPHNVVLKTDLPAPGPVIKANANQIQQVLTSLITNAWEASSRPQDGIRVTVKLAPATEISAAHRFPVGWQPQDSAYACLEVADSGRGIAAGDIENIFDPFFTSKFTGRGLGLAVVLGIVRGYDGGITVESEPGQGSVFRVFLPVSAASVPQKPIRVAPAPKTADCGGVLVVDDETPLRVTAARALQRVGYTVFAAADGVEAVELFEQHREEIHCVLCDLTMPRMGGWETLTALRKLAPRIPIILSSGYDDAKVMEGQHTELPQAFLRKPYELKALFDLVKRLQPEVPGKKRE